MSDAGSLTDGRQISGFPESFVPIVWEKFETLNTKPPRPAIADGEMFWCDGWMPIGPSNLRVLWGTGTPVFATQGGETITWFAFGNIGDTPYGVVLQSDGAVHMFNVNTGARAQVMPAGTIQAPSSIMGFSQWGSQYLIFAKDQDNGYWLWDGSSLFTAGTAGPLVTIDDAGEDYSSAPTITFQTTGAGTGAAFSADILNDNVSNVDVTNPGSGFANGDLIALNFAGGGSDDQAILSPVLSTSTGGLDTVYVILAGQAYTSRAFVQVTGGGGSGASVSLSIQNGAITGAAIVSRGTNYTSAPTLTVVDPGIPAGGGGSIPGGSGGAIACTIAFGEIVGIVVNYGGSGYVSPPTIEVLGDGSGFQGYAVIGAGQVTSIVQTNNGFGYTKALAVAKGGNKAANASMKLMPYGVSGTAAEVYQQRVWVTNGAASADFPPRNRTIYSGPGSPVDFSGGGAFASTDSFLRVGYHWLKQTNGFLYLGGDSSLNYISGVQTTASGTIATTTFGNNNVDPQLGSPWQASVQVFSRNIVFANSAGIFVSYGGAVTKASLPLDGFYGSVPLDSAPGNYSSAVATIFGIPVYMLLLPVVDQMTGQPINKLLMWDGKRWFTSQQDRELTFVATQEINSVLTAWGTDGTSIFQLFAQPSTDFSKRVQSKLFSTPAYFITKAAHSLSGVVQSFVVDEPLVITIDNEAGLGSGNASKSVSPVGSQAILTNVGGVIVVVTNAAGDPVTINGAPGLAVFGPLSVGQQGRMMGFTVQTTASDVALLSLMASEQAVSPNV